ncbi:MAG: Co2+/Mg2+ efflux protein ApaG [Myxococcales bacterium]|nr:Co2+/Mg2+ efflux protein ApaG [Myxococcales bacterium]
MGTSDTCTRGVRVQVASRYVPERSDPEHGAWFFAYTVNLVNEGEVTVQLLTRHWIITDANGSVEEVRGPGVVGAQPVLEPGESFEYTSACPLRTAFGTMHGSYQMITEDGEPFDAEIAPFSLNMPYAVN